MLQEEIPSRLRIIQSVVRNNKRYYTTSNFPLDQFHESYNLLLSFDKDIFLFPSQKFILYTYIKASYFVFGVGYKLGIYLSISLWLQVCTIFFNRFFLKIWALTSNSNESHQKIMEVRVIFRMRNVKKKGKRGVKIQIFHLNCIISWN